MLKRKCDVKGCDAEQPVLEVRGRDGARVEPVDFTAIPWTEIKVWRRGEARVFAGPFEPTAVRGTIELDGKVGTIELKPEMPPAVEPGGYVPSPKCSLYVICPKHNIVEALQLVEGVRGMVGDERAFEIAS